MYSLTFTCPASRVNKQGVSKIQLWLNVGGTRKTLVLDLSATPTTFQKMLVSRKSNPINTYCNKVRDAINTIFANNPTYTCSEILECYKTGTTTKVANTTLSYIGKEYLAVMASKVNVDFGMDTYKKYVLAINRFIEFVGGDVNITNVCNSHIITFQAHLNMDINTIGNYLKKIKHFLNWCIDNNYITTNPFKNFKIKRVVREVQYLTADEVERIYNKDFCNDRLNRVKDLFVFACHTGMAFADLSRLDKQDIQYNDGIAYVRKERCKTGVKFTTIFDEVAMAILIKYNYVLPILTNQKYNCYLKEIADLCGITKPLHTHIARHTFATMAISKGYNIMAVKEFCGHSNINQTLHYGRLVDESLFREFQKIEGSN